MNKKNLGDRIKSYEAMTENNLLPFLPVVVRLDGRSFSKFTKEMKKPFDENFNKAMIEVTKYLVKQTNAKIGYTQSDEISLILYSDNKKNNSILFEGRVQKIASNFAAMASVKFLLEMQKYFPEKVKEHQNLPSFDARVFSVPNKTEATNAIFWRTIDAQKNSISMAAQSCFSHNSLQGLSGEDKKEKMLSEKGIDWNAFHSYQKQGVFVRKESVLVKLEKEHLEKIKIEKRPENGMVNRNKVVEIDMPNFLEVTNRKQVIFEGENPVI